MIIAALITILLTLVQAIFFIVPDLPSTPEVILTMGDQLVAFVAGSVGIIAMIFTPQLLIAVATVTIVRINWVYIYAGVKFIWTKIPLLNTIKI